MKGGEPNCIKPDGDLLQAPAEYIDQQKHIPDIMRRTYAGMVGALDEGIHNVTMALKANGMLDNT